MTIICIKDGIIASDSLVSVGSICTGAVPKIFDTGLFVIGVAGDYEQALTFVQWVRQGMPDVLPDTGGVARDFDCLVYEKATKIVYFYTNSYTPGIINNKHHAIGSGYEVALGAMEAGASAEEAVKIAIKLCTTCGGKLQKQVLYEKRKKKND